MIEALLLAAAMTFAWDPVTLGEDGQALTVESAVTAYKLYSCTSATCSKSNGTVLATVNAPATTYQPTVINTPITVFVTAVNNFGESAESNRVRLVKPDLPRNVRFSF